MQEDTKSASKSAKDTLNKHHKNGRAACDTTSDQHIEKVETVETISLIETQKKSLPTWAFKTSFLHLSELTAY